MTLKIGTAAVAAATTLFIAMAPPAMARDGYRGYHGHYRGHHGYYRNNFGAGIAGFAAGAILGGALASQPRYYAYRPAYSRSVRWCMRHYRSYDPRSGTYLGYDGDRHPCP